LHVVSRRKEGTVKGIANGPHGKKVVDPSVATSAAVTVRVLYLVQEFADARLGALIAHAESFVVAESATLNNSCVSEARPDSLILTAAERRKRVLKCRASATANDPRLLAHILNCCSCKRQRRQNSALVVLHFEDTSFVVSDSGMTNDSSSLWNAKSVGDKATRVEISQQLSPDSSLFETTQKPPNRSIQVGFYVFLGATFFVGIVLHARRCRQRGKYDKRRRRLVLEISSILHTLTSQSLRFLLFV